MRGSLEVVPAWSHTPNYVSSSLTPATTSQYRTSVSVETTHSLRSWVELQRAGLARAEEKGVIQVQVLSEWYK